MRALRGGGLWLCLAMAAGAAAPPRLAQGYGQLYDRQFAAARSEFRQWAALHPDDAMGPASEAVATLFGELSRLHVVERQFASGNPNFLAGPQVTAAPAVLARLDGELAASEALAARRLAADPNDARALLAEGLCHGLAAEELALLRHRYLAALAEMKRGRAYARAALAADPGDVDAELGLGIENYLLGLHAAPVRWLLRLDGVGTNESRGLQQLRAVAAHGHYFGPYADILLALAAVGRHDPAAAERRLAPLARAYPDNALYARELRRVAAAGHRRSR